jgi:hypothetical protein
MESGHLIAAPKAATEPASDAASVFGEAWRIVRRDWRPLLAALSILWLLWVVPRVLTGVLAFGLEWNAGPAHAVILGLFVLVYALQLVAVVWLVAGIVHLHLIGCRTGERAPLGYVLSAAGRLGWLLLEVLIVAGCVLALVALYRSALPNAVLAMLPVLALLVLVALVTQPLALPLIIDRRLNTFAAMAASARIVVRKGRPSHLLVVAVAALGTLALAVASLWPGAAADDLEIRSVLGLVASSRLWLTAAVATVGVAGCLVCVPLITALYVGLTQSRPGQEPGAATAIPVRLWQPLAALAAAALLVLGLAYGAAWAFYGVDSSRELPSGVRTTLHSGVSLVLPAGSNARLVELRQYPSWLPIGQNAPTPDSYFDRAGISGRKDGLSFGERGVASATFFEMSSLYSGDAYLLHKAEHSPVLARTPDGTVIIRGNRGSRILQVVTHLPGAMPGVIWVIVRDGAKSPRPWSAERQNAALARLWRELKIEGAPLPVIH